MLRARETRCGGEKRLIVGTVRGSSFDMVYVVLERVRPVAGGFERFAARHGVVCVYLRKTRKGLKKKKSVRKSSGRWEVKLPDMYMREVSVVSLAPGAL